MTLAKVQNKVADNRIESNDTNPSPSLPNTVNAAMAETVRLVDELERILQDRGGAMDSEITSRIGDALRPSDGWTTNAYLLRVLVSHGWNSSTKQFFSPLDAGKLLSDLQSCRRVLGWAASAIHQKPAPIPLILRDPRPILSDPPVYWDKNGKTHGLYESEKK